MADWYDTFDMGGGWDNPSNYSFNDIPSPAFDFGQNYSIGNALDYGGSFNFSPQLDTGWLNTMQPPISQPGGGAPGMLQGIRGGGASGGGIGGGGWGSPQTILGGIGGLASLAGVLAGAFGGGGGPNMPTAKKAQFGQAQQAAGGLQAFGKGTTPLQQQQAQLLQAIAGGQGLAQPYAQAVEQAYQPQLGSLYEQAANQGRMRGFHDAPATSPVGGAILGPGLANLQGQMAQSKLALMQALPGLFQSPINQQMQGAQGFAQAQGNLFGAYPMGPQQQGNPWAQVGQGVGNSLVGLGQGIAQGEQQRQQQDFQNQLLQLMAQQRSPYEFGGYSGR